jgi:hypothetical protein
MGRKSETAAFRWLNFISVRLRRLWVPFLGSERKAVWSAPLPSVFTLPLVRLSVRRVDEDVAILIPRRPGCAVFPLPVLHGRASLAGVCSSATRRSRKSRRWKRGLDSKYFSMSISSTSPRFVLASSAIRCRFVDRFVRLNVLSRVSRQRFSPHGTPLSSIGSR